MKSRTPGDIAAALIIASLAMIALLDGCTSAGAPTSQAQNTIDVLCKQDAALQPVVVPVVLVTASVAAPAAAPGVAAAAQADDAVLLHPAVVMACAQYASKPAAVVAAAPAGAAVAPSVTIVAPSSDKP
jgi:hypothetical protein